VVIGKSGFGITAKWR